MSKPKLAIVGTGIAGMASAWVLKDTFEITLFEQNEAVGGHTNTIDVAHGSGTVSFDTGFMVFNKVTYPCLTAFFQELDVPIQPTDMSFSVVHEPSDLEYCGSGWNTLFADRRNLFRPNFYRMLWQINRFNREAVLALEESRWQQMSLGEYVRHRGYGDRFLNLYLLPMSSAVWSAPPGQMLSFPAMALLRFFHNHGFLGLYTQHPWWTVTGGAREYVRRLIPRLQATVRTACPVHRVERLPQGGVRLEYGQEEKATFDRVVLAGHADNMLKILADADDLETTLLRPFAYQSNLATVHTDARVMPRNRRAWASWNYRIQKLETPRPSHFRIVEGSDLLCQTVYWMNRLQKLPEDVPYFVSINGEHSGKIAEDRILRQIPYTHPIFTLDTMRAQDRLQDLNRRSSNQPVFFCGSYFRHGFHEDAFQSAVRVARALLGKKVYGAVLKD